MSSSAVGNLLRYLGISGTSGFNTGQLVPRGQTPDLEGRLERDFQEGGRVADPDIWTRYGAVQRRPVTYEAMLALWEEMSNWDLMAAALVEVVDEATQMDAQSPSTLWFECNDPEFEKDLNQLLLKLDAETILPSQIWHVAGLGNHFEKLDYAPKEGVMGMSFVHPLDVRRYWLERNRQCIGYKWGRHKPDKSDAFVGPDNQPIERVALSYDNGIEDLYYPWDFMHIRRMFRLRTQEHGEPLFDEAQGIYKKLRIAIDQMVVHRAQVQPDRYAINIDVAEQPPTEQMKTVQRWKQRLRNKLAFGRGSSPDQVSDPTDFTSFYNAMALDTVLWVARPKGFTHSIDKIAGTTVIPDVYDIEMLTNLFFSIIGMPKSWIGLGGGSSENNPQSGRALLASDMRFLRKIKSIRRPLIQSWTWLGYFHAILKQKNPAELEIRAKMPPIGSLEDQLKLEMVDLQADIMTKLGEVMKAYNLPREAWIEVIFKRYMHLPDDVINVFLTSLPPEMPAQEESIVDGAEFPKKKPAPSTSKIMREIHEKMDRPTMKMIHEAKELLRKESFDGDKRSRRVYKDVAEVLNAPKIQERDLVVSSYGNNPLRPTTRAAAATTTALTQRIEESPVAKEPAWRAYISSTNGKK